jgi:hypothetical protein
MFLIANVAMPLQPSITTLSQEFAHKGIIDVLPDHLDRLDSMTAQLEMFGARVQEMTVLLHQVVSFFKLIILKLNVSAPVKDNDGFSRRTDLATIAAKSSIC